MKRGLTRMLGRGVFASQLDPLFFRHAAVVVAFHRVGRCSASDGLTVDVEMFERFCAFFKQHFHVVALRDLVGKLERGDALHRELAITFDDGYRDNFENAAPVLERLGLPATFFVISGWIGTGIVPPWDRTCRCGHPWMTWAEVESLQRRGFDIGAHTRTHIDLGVASAADAGEELLGARRDLESRLGGPVDMFAYPYGRQQNIAPSNRALVRAAGFRCCCSCFGGSTRSGSDPFHLARVPISSWYASPQQFFLEVALGRSVSFA
jgi:peptidoglycan/xylan/chitin deacetylase (PgdA/CDA1 family)